MRRNDDRAAVIPLFGVHPSAPADDAPGPDVLAERLGALLVERGKLAPAGLDRARRAQAESGGRLDQILTRLGLVADRDLIEALAALLQLPISTAADFPDSALLEGSLSIKFLKRVRVLPLRDGAAELVVAMADPLDHEAVQALALACGKTIRATLATPAEIENALDRLYGRARTPLDEIAETAVAESAAEEDVEKLKDLASEAPVIRLVNLLITQAVEARASDIHIEPYEGRLRARYRIDGVLRDVDAPPSTLAAAVVSRIKIMAKLNIAERRLPQDGRTKMAIRGREIDLRVSTLPAMHGEKVVLRILDRGAAVFDFPALGFESELLSQYRALLARPHGILLVTGPTGSGKTTTLYASLLTLNTSEVNILSVEDPVEYQLDGVNQVQVKPQIGLTFANVLRSFLRQDPDIIMIGEIRDGETAQIAVQAALTGHLVLSTLHTNNAAGTVTRLLDMEIEGHLLNSTVNGVLAQRLVRTLCPDCRQPYHPLPDLAREMALHRHTQGEPVLYRAVGCRRCGGTGFRGRTSILELLVMTDAIRAQVLRHADARAIQHAATEQGMRTMLEDGMRKALAGVTTIEEVMRVIRE